jgi:hypothetical protein
VKVAMREIALEPSSGEAPLRSTTSGAYTDPAATIDIAAGLPRCAATGSWRAAMWRHIPRAK